MTAVLNDGQGCQSALYNGYSHKHKQAKLVRNLLCSQHDALRLAWKQRTGFILSIGRLFVRPIGWPVSETWQGERWRHGVGAPFMNSMTGCWLTSCCNLCCNGCFCVLAACPLTAGECDAGADVDGAPAAHLEKFRSCFVTVNPTWT